MAKISAAQVGEIWEQVMRERPVDFSSDIFTRKPGPPPSAEEVAAREAEWAIWDAEQAAATALRQAKFMGEVVAVESADGDDVLVYADGRRLRIISEWYEWEAPVA